MKRIILAISVCIALLVLNVKMVETKALQYYTVNFIDWDGSIYHTDQVLHGNDIYFPSTDPIRDGYTFNGWLGNRLNVTENRNMYADYDPIIVVENHFVQFLYYNDNNVLTEFDSQYIEDGGNAISPTPPIKDGYVFSHYDKSFTNVTSDLTVTAIYKAVWTVTFEDYNGTPLKIQEVVSGNNATPPNDPVRTGYTFNGWLGSYNNVTSNRKITANYTIIQEEQIFWTVTVLSWNGAFLNEYEVLDGTNANIPIPTREGYVFIEWDQSINNVSSDLIITPIYEEYIPSNIEYTVIYYDFDNTFLGTETVLDGNNAIGLTPTREGFNFVGWSDTIDNITGNLEVVARYEYITVNSFTWSYKLDFDVYPTAIDNWQDLSTNLGGVINNDILLIDSVGSSANTFELHDVIDNTKISLLEFSVKVNSFGNGLDSEGGHNVFIIDGEKLFRIVLLGNSIRYQIGQTYETVNTIDLTSSFNKISMKLNKNINAEVYINDELIINIPYTSLLDLAYNRVSFGDQTGSRDAITEWEYFYIQTDLENNPISPQYFNIEYYEEDGTYIETQIILSGGNSTPPTPQVKLGYNFIGWSESTDNITSTKYLYAQYELIPIEYEQFISFDYDIPFNDIDYSTSVIGFFGSNLKVKFYGEVLETDKIENFNIKIEHFYNNNHFTYYPTWNGNKFEFDFTDYEQILIKNTLFDRDDKNYINVYSYDNLTSDNVDFYIYFESNFDFNVDIKSLHYISVLGTPLVDPVTINYDWYRNNANVVEYSSNMYFSLYDNKDNLMGSLEYTDNVSNNKFLGLPSRYTNISSFVIHFENIFTNSLCSTDDCGVGWQLLEVSLFSDLEVIRPSYIADDFDHSIREPQYKTCVWTNMFCHIENGFEYVMYGNEISASIQNTIGKAQDSFGRVTQFIDMFTEIVFVRIAFGTVILVFVLRKVTS